MYKGIKITMEADSSSETMQTIRQKSNIFKITEEKYYTPRILYPGRISFKNEGQIKIF